MVDGRETSELVTEFSQNPGLESETVDMKSKEILNSTPQKKKLVRVLSEFANNRGGSVIIGVRIEEGDLRLQGFDVDSEYKQEVTQIIQEYASIHLSDLCEFNFETHSGKRLLRIDVSEARERLVKIEIDGERQIRIRDKDGGREMTAGEIARFYEEIHRTEEEIQGIREIAEIETPNPEESPPVLEPFNGHPTIQLDSDDLTAIFLNGVSIPSIGHTHTYLLQSPLPHNIVYEDVLELLQDVSDKMGGGLEHGFGYTFRWGDTQVVGRTIEALRSDLNQFEDLAEHLARTGTQTSIYQPILAGALSCRYGLFWFELQREGDTFVRGEFQLIAPDIPLDSSNIKDVFSSHGSTPETYEQQAGVQMLRISQPGLGKLKQARPRSVGKTDDYEITNVVCDNPMYKSPKGTSGRLDSTSKRIQRQLSKICRIPFDVSGGFIEDGSNQVDFRRIEAMTVGATFPTLLVESRSVQR